MRIALFTDGVFPYVIGGMQKHSFNLAKYFARNKVAVDLYHCNQSQYDISKLELFSEVEKKYIRSFVIDFPSFGNLPGHYIRESFEYSRRIFDLFRKNADVDFVYAKGFTAWKLLDEKGKGFKCPPIGVNFHGYEMFQKAASFRSRLEQVLLLRKPVLFNIEKADRLFSYGGKITELIRSQGIPDEKIIESPACIESDWMVQNIQPTGDIRKFIFVGRYERRKGIEELNSVLPELLQDNKFEFFFVGDIPEGKKIMSENIQYLSKITEANEMKKALRNADVLVCPSYSEGMPNVILEAMACGLAVIATDVGAMNLMVSDQNGWLISPGSKEELNNALRAAIHMPTAELDEMKKASLRSARKYLWDKVSEDLLRKIELAK